MKRPSLEDLEDGAKPLEMESLELDWLGLCGLLNLLRADGPLPDDDNDKFDGLDGSSV